MNHLRFFLLPIAVVIGFDGCAKDPVAELLKSNGGFAVVRPPSNGEYLGDVHRSKNLVEKSISMKDVMDAESLKNMMNSRIEQVDIPSTSGNKDFELSLEAAYVGFAKGDLEITGARKYRVTVSKPVIYDSPFDSHLAPVLVPTIKRRFPDVSLQGKYIVRSLLEVGGLEYEFFREDGGKINISADQKLVHNLTATLGNDWKVTREGKLTITQPRLIGYRLARVDKEGGLVAALPAGSQQPADQEPKLSKVPISDYEDRDLREQKSNNITESRPNLNE